MLGAAGIEMTNDEWRMTNGKRGRGKMQGGLHEGFSARCVRHQMRVPAGNLSPLIRHPAPWMDDPASSARLGEDVVEDSWMHLRSPWHGMYSPVSLDAPGHGLDAIRSPHHGPSAVANSRSTRSW